MTRRFQFSLFKLLLLTLLLDELICGTAYLVRTGREETIQKARAERGRIRSEILETQELGRTVPPATRKRWHELNARLYRLGVNP